MKKISWIIIESSQYLPSTSLDPPIPNKSHHIATSHLGLILCFLINSWFHGTQEIAPHQRRPDLRISVHDSEPPRKEDSFQAVPGASDYDLLPVWLYMYMVVWVVRIKIFIYMSISRAPSVFWFVYYAWWQKKSETSPNDVEQKASLYLIQQNKAELVPLLLLLRHDLNLASRVSFTRTQCMLAMHSVSAYLPYKQLFSVAESWIVIEAISATWCNVVLYVACLEFGVVNLSFASLNTIRRTCKAVRITTTLFRPCLFNRDCIDYHNSKLKSENAAGSNLFANIF